MRFREMARSLVAAYHRIVREPAPFWPAFEDEVRKIVTADAPAAGGAEARAAARQRRERAIDAPSDQTTTVRCPRPGLQRGVTYLGRLTPPADPPATAAPVPAAPRGASASR